jgi:hypothetical protein
VKAVEEHVRLRLLDCRHSAPGGRPHAVENKAAISTGDDSHPPIGHRSAMHG